MTLEGSSSSSTRFASLKLECCPLSNRYCATAPIRGPLTPLRTCGDQEVSNNSLVKVCEWTGFYLNNLHGYVSSYCQRQYGTVSLVKTSFSSFELLGKSPDSSKTSSAAMSIWPQPLAIRVLMLVPKMHSEKPDHRIAEAHLAVSFVNDSVELRKTYHRARLGVGVQTQN